MKNKDKPAMATMDQFISKDLSFGKEIKGHSGLTKREYFSSAAMQGLLAQDLETGVGLARLSVHQADLLLQALESDTTNPIEVRDKGLEDE